jgi:O-antigen ligase
MNASPSISKPAPDVVGGALLVALGAAVLTSWRPIPVFAGAIGLIGLLVTFRRPDLLLYGFVLCLLAIGDIFSMDPVTQVPVRIYPADYLVLLLAAALLSLRRTAVRSLLAEPQTWLLLASLVYGVVQLLYAMAFTEHEMNAILGDFRRLYFYPLAFFTPMLLWRSRSSLRPLATLLVLATLIIAVFACYRALSGNTWRPGIHGRLGDFRSISPFDGVPLMATFSLCLLDLLRSQRLRARSIVLAMIIIFVCVIGNWRIFWALLPLLCVFTVFLKSRKLLTWKLVLPLVALLLGLVAVFTASRLSPDVFRNLEYRFSKEVVNVSKDQDPRYHAWQETLRLARQSPVIGVGIGHQLVFYALTSARTWTLSSQTTTHSIVLSYLYETGIIGLLLFLGIHGLFFLRVGLPILRSQFPEADLAYALLVGYIVIMLMSMVQPFGSDSPGAACLLYILMGTLTLWQAQQTRNISRVAQAQVMPAST